MASIGPSERNHDHHSKAAGRDPDGTDPQPADVFVIFGITGDLAKVMTFHSLYRLEQRGLLDCPIVGVAVDDWTVDDLREHARELDRGTAARRSTKRCSTGSPTGCRTSPATSPTPRPSSGSRRRSRTRSSPVFYLEIPPFLFGTVIKGLPSRA